MRKLIVKLIVGFIVFGLALGLTLVLGDTLFDPIKEVLWSNNDVRNTIIEVIGFRIIQFIGVFFYLDCCFYCK